MLCFISQNGEIKHPQNPNAQSSGELDGESPEGGSTQTEETPVLLHVLKATGDLV